MKKGEVKSSKNLELTIVTIGLFVLFAILLNFVNVTNAPNVTATGHATSFVSDLFANWSEGNLDINIAKYLFWIILSAFIFGALAFAKFPDSTFLQLILALPIGFLITAYITPSELFTVLTTYSALGLTLSVIIPFVILLFFSAMLLSNEKLSSMTVGRMILQIAMWLLFLGFMIYKLIAGFPGVSLSSGVSIVMFVVLAISLGIVLFNRQFRQWIRALGLEIRRARADVEAEARRLEQRAGFSETARH